MAEVNRLRLATELDAVRGQPLWYHSPHGRLTATSPIQKIIDRLRAGYYDEFSDDSPLELPDVALVNDLHQAGLPEFSKRVRDGEFDATTEESDAWAARQQHDHSEGQDNCTRCILEMMPQMNVQRAKGAGGR